MREFLEARSGRETLLHAQYCFCLESVDTGSLSRVVNNSVNRIFRDFRICGLLEGEEGYLFDFQQFILILQPIVLC